MSPAEKRYAAFELERYLAGELDADAKMKIEGAAAEDPALKEMIEARRREHAAFFADPRRRPFARLVHEAGVEKRASFRAVLVPMFAAAAAVAVLVIAGRPPVERAIGVKGRGLSVKAAVLEGESPRLFDGGTLRPGSRLRLSVDDAQGGYVTVIMEEASGGIAVLYDSKELGRLTPGTHHLPGSLELDGRLGRERLYVLMSDDEPQMDHWVEELRAAHQKLGFAHGWLPEGATRVSLLEYEKVK